MEKIVAGMSKTELAVAINSLVRSGGKILDGEREAAKTAAAIFVAFSAVIPVEFDAEKGTPDVVKWVNTFMAAHVPERYLVAKQGENGGFYSFTSRQMQQTAMGKGLKALADFIRNKFAAEARKAAEAEAEAKAEAEAAEADKVQRELAEAGFGETETAEAAEGETAVVKSAASDLSTLELLELLAVRMPEKVGTITKWLKELAV